MREETWLSCSQVKFACQLESVDDTQNDLVIGIITLLDKFCIKHDLRITREFQSEVRLCSTQLGSLVADIVFSSSMVCDSFEVNLSTL